MSKWLQKFLEKEAQTCTDSTDRFNPNANMSVLSVPSQASSQFFMDKEIKNKKNIFKIHTDNTDRFTTDANMSVLSDPLRESLDKNLGNMPGTRTDNTDRFNPNTNMSVLSSPPEEASDGELKSISKIVTVHLPPKVLPQYIN